MGHFRYSSQSPFHRIPKFRNTSAFLGSKRSPCLSVCKLIGQQPIELQNIRHAVVNLKRLAGNKRDVITFLFEELTEYASASQFSKYASIVHGSGTAINHECDTDGSFRIPMEVRNPLGNSIRLEQKVFRTEILHGATGTIRDPSNDV